MTARTYTEAQYSTPAAMEMIRDRILCGATDQSSIESAAKYLSRTLRIGPLKICRALVVGAVNAAAPRG